MARTVSAETIKLNGKTLSLSGGLLALDGVTIPSVGTTIGTVAALGAGGVFSLTVLPVGTTVNTIPLLGASGKLDIARLPTGTADGDIPVLSTGGYLSVSLLPPAATFKNDNNVVVVYMQGGPNYPNGIWLNHGVEIGNDVGCYVDEDGNAHFNQLTAGPSGPITARLKVDEDGYVTIKDYDGRAMIDGAGSEIGALAFRFFSGENESYLYPLDSVTGGRIWRLPNKDGTVAMTSDMITSISMSAEGGFFFDASFEITDGIAIGEFQLRNILSRKVFCGPAFGGSATPTFRNLENDDLPVIDPTTKIGTATGAITLTSTGADINLAPNLLVGFVNTYGAGTIKHFSPSTSGTPSNRFYNSSGVLKAGVQFKDSAVANGNSLAIGAKGTGITTRFIYQNAGVDADSLVINTDGSMWAYTNLTTSANLTLHEGAFSGKDDGGAQYFSFYWDDAIRLSRVALHQTNVEGSIYANLQLNALTAIRDVTFPDKSGTLAMTSDINGGAKVYRALLNQASTNDPAATILENSLTGTIVWTRVTNGDYTGTLTGAFLVAKTFCLIGHSLEIPGDTNQVIAARSSNNTIKVKTLSDGVPSDGILVDVPIEILVYP